MSRVGASFGPLRLQRQALHRVLRQPGARQTRLAGGLQLVRGPGFPGTDALREVALGGMQSMITPNLPTKIIPAKRA